MASEQTPIQVFEASLTAKLGQPTAVTSPAEVNAVWTNLPGLEVALCRFPVPRASYGRVWRERQRGRGRPLIVVLPSSSELGALMVIGPREAVTRTPFLVKDPDALAAIIESGRTLPPSAASRQIEQALETLSRIAVPGVTVHGLLTDHFVRRRLHQLDSYGPLRAELASWAEKAMTASGWQARLQALGYQLHQLQPTGWLASANGRRLIVIHPQPTREHFARMDEHGRLPEGALVARCQEQGASWGLLTAGDTMRLYPSTADRGAATDRWLEIDPASLDGERLYLLGLLAPGSLAEGGKLPGLLKASLDFGIELYKNLDEQIRRHSLPQIARGLGQWLVEREGADLKKPARRQLIQQATYTLLFRLLFILYGESAGYLPYEQSAAYTTGSLRKLCEEARRRRDNADPRSTFLWDGLRRLTRALSTGDTAMSLPAYNGSLFHASDLPGAELLERASISDAYLAPALDALGYDYRNTDQELGIDYATLEIGHLGAIYEGLLALRLSLADQTYRWDRSRDRFVPANEPGEDGVAEGELFFQTEAGGRKGGGVYYTRQELVRHLVNQAVLPALDEHLEQVRRRAQASPIEAARLLFRFRVLDPAMGSAHFLVDALDVIADRVEKFLAETPLAPIRSRLEGLRALAGASAETVEDGRLLRRLLLKHCIYGVDLSEMATELGRVALWLASFVPGLALSYLNHNIRQGNSLVGLTSLDFLARRGFLWATPIGPAAGTLKRLSDLALELGDLQDRTPEEVRQSRVLEEEIEKVGAGLQRAFDLWTAEPFGVAGARGVLLDAKSVLDGDMTADVAAKVVAATEIATDRHFFHWPLAFPEVFHPSSERNPGFDAVVGNPPWDEITVERLGFLALHDPGLRGLTSRNEQEHRAAALVARFPELEQQFRERQAELELQRAFFRPENGYVIQGAGDLDLYELFCERYQSLGRAGGRIGVVLPRSAFLADGSQGFRRWLFGASAVTRIDFLLNKARWAFDMEPRYTVALLSTHAQTPPKGHSFRTSGPSESLGQFEANASSSGVSISIDDLAAWTPAPAGSGTREPTWEVPLLPTQRHADLFAKLRRGPRFDRWGADKGGVFPVREMDETNDKKFFSHAQGIPVWKGGSFDQYDPHGRDPAGHADWAEVLGFLQKKRERSRTFRQYFDAKLLADVASHPIHGARLALRDVTNRTNSRTVISCLIPPRTPLTNSAPYLVFGRPEATALSYALGILNSLPFDWQARRLVETHLNFFVLDLLCLPPDESRLADIASRAARLSCLDNRFAVFAAEAGVEYGPLATEERRKLRAEIDALVAHAYGLTVDDLRFVFEDFTLEAVSSDYRALVMQCFEELR
jgi:hypothetical protein